MNIDDMKRELRYIEEQLDFMETTDDRYDDYLIRQEELKQAIKKLEKVRKKAIKC